MRRAGSPGRWAGLVLVTALAVLVAVPTVGFAAGASRPGSPPSNALPPSANSGPTVLWNGANVNTASSASSAFTVTFNEAVDVNYSWVRSAYPGVSDARLQMLYFGFPLSTRDVSPIAGPASTPGLAVMNWTVGAIQYAVEGVFGLTVSLLNNGTTLWSENFYVRLMAPYSILAALPILLILIGVYELYGLARSGRQAALGRRASGGGPPPAAGAETAAPPTETAAPTAPAAPTDTETPPPADPGTPPPGGTS
jgi:hypothetical protein